MRLVRANALQFMIGFTAMLALPGIVMGVEATFLDSDDPAPARVVTQADRPSDTGDVRDPALTHPDTLDDPATPARKKADTRDERKQPKNREDSQPERERGKADRVEADEEDALTPLRAVAPELATPELVVERALGEIEALVEPTEPIAGVIEDIEETADRVTRPVEDCIITGEATECDAGEIVPLPECAEPVANPPAAVPPSAEELAKVIELGVLCAAPVPEQPQDEATAPPLNAGIAAFVLAALETRASR